MATHTIWSDDVTPLYRLPPEEARTIAEVLAADLTAAHLPEPASAATAAARLAQDARKLESDWRQAVDSAPKVGTPRLTVIGAMKGLRAAAEAEASLGAESSASGMASQVTTYLASHGITGTAWEVADIANGLVEALRTPEAQVLRTVTLLRVRIAALEAAEAELDAALRQIVPGGLRQVRTLRVQIHEQLATAVFGAYAATVDDPDRRHAALGRFVRARQERGQRLAAKRPRRRAVDASNAIVT